jgi:hypothetical protein
MSISSYEFIEPAMGVLGDAFREWAWREPGRAARLVYALEAFQGRDLGLSCLVAENDDGSRQIYLEPPRFVLANVPDAACLIRVDHGAGEFEIAHILEDYGGVGEREQWAAAVAIGQGFV